MKECSNDSKNSKKVIDTINKKNIKKYSNIKKHVDSKYNLAKH